MFYWFDIFIYVKKNKSRVKRNRLKFKKSQIDQINKINEIDKINKINKINGVNKTKKGRAYCLLFQ